MNFLFPDRPTVMGILNVTPDSFSDGGEYVNLDDALYRAEQMQQQGADIIDVGGESTRPGAKPVSVAEELGRVVPIVEAIRRNLDICVSVDTSTPEVMQATAAIGIDLINDVRALTRPGALEAAADSGVAVCLMHMQGEPDSMQDNPSYENLLVEISSFLKERIEASIAAGVPGDQLLLDPGFGFGKTVEHNLALIDRLEKFADLGCPLLVGLSRKSTIRKLLGDNSEALKVGSLAGAIWAYQKGAQVLRVHDVEETKWALTMAAHFANS